MSAHSEEADDSLQANRLKDPDKLELGHVQSGAWQTSFGAGELENFKVGGGVDPVFEAKAAVINSAFQQIGMGKYQWKLFALCGFGWVEIMRL